MRRLLICAAAFAALAFSSDAPVEAGYGYRAAPVGFFGRLMEMERRKNDFLLRLFGLR
jgi:hypothetical protein